MPSLRRPRRQRGLDELVPLACLVALLAAYSRYDWANPRRPTNLATGWWSFSDQARYLTDVLAWAAGSLDAARHYYMPGYGLIALPFLPATPANPFYLPDAALLLASLWLTAAISAELLPGWRWARAMGAGAFLLTAAMPATMEVWVTPWTTTPAAALILGCLLALLRLLRNPASWRLALVATLCAAGLVAFRPGDAMLMLPLTLLVGAARLLAAQPGRAASSRVVAAACLGSLAPLLVTAVFYLATHGLRFSDYLLYSASLGFEWRLLPLQWVTLVLDPQPMLPEGSGLLPSYPFIATGLAGIAACLAAPPGWGGRAAHAVMAAGTLGYGALYLCYRDLHPHGLWSYYNYHYFKWLLPVFGLYTMLLVLALRRWQAGLAAACVLAAILPWRAETQVGAPFVPSVEAGHSMALPASLRIGRALVVAAQTSPDSAYGGTNHFFFGPAGQRWYGAKGSIETYPIPGGLMLAPLRPLVPGAGWAILDPRVTLDPAFTPRLARLSLVYGRPCYLPTWLGSDQAHCTFVDPIPATTLPTGKPVPLDGAGSRFLTTGWAIADEGGQWTVGDRAGLRGRVQAALPHGGTVSLEASGFVPPGSPPLQVSLSAGGTVRGRWAIADSDLQVLRIALPADAFGPDGLLQITLTIDNPRRPADWGGSDTRLLGLLVRSIAMEPRG